MIYICEACEENPDWDCEDPDHCMVELERRMEQAEARADEIKEAE
mgnify:CR=1 FL=1